MFSIIVKNNINIKQCFKFQLSERKSQNFCKKCHKNDKMVHEDEIYSSPNIFLFLLDRGINFNGPKNSEIPFIIEDKIKMDDFIETKDESSPLNYELIGIISFSKNDDKYITMSKSFIDNKWYIFNDEKVQPIEHDNVIKLNNNNNYYIPCILIYKRINKNNQ